MIVSLMGANHDIFIAVSSGSRWLTWVFQVMPVFFLVGGYSNGIGLDVFPGSGAWWLIRPVWLLVYLLALLPFALWFGLRVVVLLLPFAGAVLAGVNPFRNQSGTNTQA